MKTEHTKGEWIVAENHIKDNHYQYTILGEYGRIEVATVIRHNFKEVGKSKFKDKNTLFKCKESEANEKLIAAAPLMLEALILMDKHNRIPPVKWDVKMYEGYQFVKEVIKKSN